MIRVKYRQQPTSELSHVPFFSGIVYDIVSSKLNKEYEKSFKSLYNEDFPPGGERGYLILKKINFEDGNYNIFLRYSFGFSEGTINVYELIVHNNPTNKILDLINETNELEGAFNNID